VTRTARLSLTLLVLPFFLAAQGGYPRTRRGTTAPLPPPATAPKGVVLVFHGKLKVLDKKKIVIETEESQLLTIKLTSKTKFLSDGKEVKPATIDLDAPLTVDVNQDTDASFLAVNVTVDSPEKSNQDKPAPEKTNPKPD